MRRRSPKTAVKESPAQAAHVFHGSSNNSDNLSSFARLTDRRVLLALLFILSLIIRIMYANAGIPHFDSIADANKAPLSIENGKLEYSYGYGAPGIVVLLTAVYAVDHWITGAQNAEFAYFFITILSAALAIAALYLVVEKLTHDKFIAFFSGLFFSLTPIFLSITTYPKTHAPAALFSLLGGYLLLKARDEGADSQAKLLILSGLCLSFAISIRIFSLFFIIPFVILYLNPRLSGGKLLLNKNALSLRNISLFCAALFIVVFVLFIPKFLTVGFEGFVNSLIGERGTVAWQGAFSDRLGEAFSEIKISLTFLGIIAIILGILWLLKRKEYLTLTALAAWFFLFFLYFGNLRGVEARFLTESLIPLMILMACGVKLLAELDLKKLSPQITREHVMIGAAVIGILLSLNMFFVIEPIISARHEYSGQKEFAKWVGSFTERNSMLITNDEGFFYTFYTGKDFIGHYYSASEQDIIDTVSKIKALLESGVSVYMTDSGIGGGMAQQFANALQQNFDIAILGARPNEFYSRNTLHFQKYPDPGERLFRITLKKAP